MPRRKKNEDVEINGGKVVNFYETMPSQFHDVKLPNPNFNLHHFNIPFRLCCVAPSGSGKSNWVTNLISLFSKGNGTFAYVYIICKDSSEPLYRYLASLSEQIIIKEGLHNLPQLDKFDKDVATLVIIDDCQMDRGQERICEYYIRCRKKSVSIAYLAQNYYSIPKVIRANCNYMVLLRISGQREISMILKEGGLGLEKHQLLKMYSFATDTKFVPMIIDCESTDNRRKYRKGFQEFINPDDYK